MFICPKCGAEETSKPFIGSFCIDCHYIKIKIPNKIEIIQCPCCLKIRLRGEWTGFSEEKVCNYVIEQFKGDFTKAEFLLEKKQAIFSIEKDGKKTEVNKKINFAIRRNMCRDCSRAKGGYFEAILQLRGADSQIEKYMRVFERKIKKGKLAISRILEVKNGVDLYCMSAKITREILDELDLKYTISRTLAGQEQGKKFYRITFLVRFDTPPT